VSAQEYSQEATLAATNVFKRDETGAWKMVMHQAGPCEENHREFERERG